MKFKPKPSLKVIETITRPGSTFKENEDRVGFNQCCAFVLDGATTLGDVQFMKGYGSDAAWLSEIAKQNLEREVRPDSDLGQFIANFIDTARKTYFNSVNARDVQRFAWPSASMAIIHIGTKVISFRGFGDCTLILEDKTGHLTIHSPLSGFADWETQRASQHIKRLGGMKNITILNDETTLQDMRKVRSRQNTSGSNVWTLGIVPEAAEHLYDEQLNIAQPAQGLLCTDGFYALVENYNAYTDRSLMNAVISDGLNGLLEELRQIETKLDPDATLYPRFKQSDDASAVYFEIY